MYKDKQIKSALIYDALEIIIKKFNLNLDQLGELDVLTQQALKGEVSSQEFYPEMKKRLEIDDALAIELTKVVNTEIFANLYKYISEHTDDNQIESPDAILAHIENPETPVAQRVVTPFSVPIVPPVSSSPIVDDASQNISKGVSGSSMSDVGVDQESKPEYLLPELEPEHRIAIKVIKDNTDDTVGGVGGTSGVEQTSPKPSSYSIADTKLSQSTSIPTQKITQGLTASTPEPTSYTVDPYREPPTP